MFLTILLILWGVVFFLAGIYTERYSLGMRPSRFFELCGKGLFTLLTFGRYYICDGCSKIHKRTSNDIGIFKHKVFVSKDCVASSCLKAIEMLDVTALTEDYIVSYLAVLEQQATDERDKRVLRAASERLKDQMDILEDLYRNRYNR